MSIEEQIQVTGAGQAAREVDRVGDATGRVGDKTETAGSEAERGARGFDGLGNSVTGAGGKLQSFAQGMFGLDALLNLVTKISERMERIVQMRRELADQSTGALT